MRTLYSILSLLLMLSGCGNPEVTTPDVAPDVTEDVAPDVPVYTCDPQFSGSYEQPAFHDCHLVDQACSLPTEACFLGERKAQCLEIGTVPCQGICEVANDCSEGAVCIGDPGRCLALCSPGTTCQVGTRCRVIPEFASVGFCPLPCSVLAQDCPGNLGCYLISGNQECAPPASPGLQKGQLCDMANRCAVGLICQEADGARCREPCAVGGTPCHSGTCTGLVGLEPLGVCIESQ